jgi:predicted PurR-regulated permease PerM
VDQPTFKIGNFLWQSSLGAVAAMGQAAMVVFLVFFLLIGGDTFKRKLVRLTGPSLTKRKITVNILDDINSSIQKYMLMLLATNLLVALLTWIAFRWIGLENAGAWLLCRCPHIVPYLGPGVTAIATGMAAYMQFESFGPALLVAGASMAIATLVGTFVTTWMTGRIANMNSASVFIRCCSGAGYGESGGCCSASPSSSSSKLCRSILSSCIRWPSCWGIDSSPESLRVRETAIER